MSLRDLPSLLKRRASSVRGWKVLPRARHSVSATDLGPQVHRAAVPRHSERSQSQTRLPPPRQAAEESFLPGAVHASPTNARSVEADSRLLKVPERGSEDVPTPSTGSSGVLQTTLLRPETPPCTRSCPVGFDHVTYFSDLQRPGNRPRPRPSFLQMDEVQK
ncbi:unnamed protein product [Durusdinium trenchii]|uniref:Uncharacterized protein n=1 Tax=Durusdinium trenchii TaxID=1381693 RepID=A0ABP0SBU1_9DINO